MDKKLNTTVEFEFCDGTKTELTLTFYKVYQLKNKNKALYTRYCKLESKQDVDVIEMITILYTGYVCAHLDEENLMSEEDFMILCGSDREAVGKAISALYMPKKQ